MAWTVVQKNSVMQQLIQGGLSPYGAAGLVSRWSVVENPSGDPSIFGGYKGRAFGHAQWLEPRRSQLWSWADENGLDPNSTAVQTQYALEELQSSENIAGSYLTSARDPITAAIGASHFERAEGFNAETGRDNFTDRTAEHIPGILGDYNNAAALGELQREGLFGFGNDDGTVPIDDQNYDPFVDHPADIEKAIEAGDPATAGEKVAEAGKTKKPETKRAPEGSNLVQAINKQSEQLQKNTEAVVAAANQNTKSAINAASGVSTGFQSLFSNLFVRFSLVALGAIFILAGVYGLAMGNGVMVAAVAKVAK